MERVLRAFPPLLLLASLAAALPALAGAPDWSALRDVETVEIVTTDADGSARETTIWLAVVDGQGYIRTGSTRWRANIERDPDVTLRIEGTAYPLRAEAVTDAELKARIAQALREKYGLADAFVGIFRGSDPNIMRLVPR